MALIAPFRGITYDFHKKQDLSRVVTPPYDVISEKEQDAFYAADPYNIIRLILGKRKVGDTDWDSRYSRATELFKRWEAEQILVRSPHPAMYLTSLTYDPKNGAPHRTRWGLIALLKIEEEDSRVILPHEKTFSAHKNDRLKLYRACNAQFSQIFGLFEDPENAIIDACRNVSPPDPAVSFDFEDNTTHQMWIINNPSLFKKVGDLMKEKPIFIADGHHRYETSRNYRNIMRERYGRRPPNKPYEYVMMYLSNMHDAGLTILPSHRLVKKTSGFRLETFLDKLKQWFDIASYPYAAGAPSNDCAAIQAKISADSDNNTAFAFCVHDVPRYYVLSLKPGARDALGPDIHASLKKLDVLVLSKLIFEKTLGFTKADMDNNEIFHYQSNMETAVDEVAAGNVQMAFLLNPTRIDQVIGIANNALVMPRKSTFFYPKVLTGLVLNKIDPNEIIQVPGH